MNATGQGAPQFQEPPKNGLNWGEKFGSPGTVLQTCQVTLG